MTDLTFGFCERCYRLVELEVGGTLTEHYRYTTRLSDAVYNKDLCAGSLGDPAPLPMEEE